MIATNVHEELARAERIQRAFDSGQDGVIERAAFKSLTDAIETTKNAIGVRPDGTRWHFARPENFWRVRNTGPGTRVVECVGNEDTPGGDEPNKVMSWLEYGTQAHGPRFAKMLFIPLSRRAADAYRNRTGFASAPTETTEEATGFTAGGALRGKRRRRSFIIRALRKRKGKLVRQGVKLVWGTDYVLAKRVKGITARNLIPGMVERSQTLLQGEMEAFLEKIFAQ